MPRSAMTRRQYVRRCDEEAEHDLMSSGCGGNGCDTLSATIMTFQSTISISDALACIKVWCLLIDHQYKPTFGEPFPVTINKLSGTTHEVKINICVPPKSTSERRPHLKVATNKVEIWKCKDLKLSAKDSFGQIQMQLDKFRFSYDELSDAQHLGVAQMIRELELEDCELLLARIPQSCKWCSFLYPVLHTERTWQNFRNHLGQLCL
jgi:hypothetical protein